MDKDFKFTPQSFSKVLSEKGIWSDINEKGELIIKLEDADKALSIENELKTAYNDLLHIKKLI